MNPLKHVGGQLCSRNGGLRGVAANHQAHHASYEQFLLASGKHVGIEQHE